MKQEFFTYLPSEIIIDILSRLPVRTIVRCKCVCKSWLHLVETHEFAKSHLSKSVPGLAISAFLGEQEAIMYRIFEFEDGLDLERHEDHYNPLTKFNFPHFTLIKGSADGLLLLDNLSTNPHALCICNPITRDYIELHCPQEFAYPHPQVVTYGFGVSKMTGQHKVVRICHDCIHDQETGELLEVTKFECWVYTLESGSWRSISPGAPFKHSSHTIGALLFGNLHWLVYDLKGFPLISCFDLETELFTTFAFPLRGSGGFLTGPFDLGDCLCLCDYDDDGVIIIWSMKKYRVEKSWTKEFVIKNYYLGVPHHVYPVKVFKDGDILMALEGILLFYYSTETETTEQIDIFELPGDYVNSILHTPSFLSLKSFGAESVSLF